MSRSFWGRPSSVHTGFPSALAASTTQDTTAFPSSITVQQPHCPIGAQPFLGEIRSQRSRSAVISDSSSAALTWVGLPLSWKEMVRSWLMGREDTTDPARLLARADLVLRHQLGHLVGELLHVPGGHLQLPDAAGALVHRPVDVAHRL